MRIYYVDVPVSKLKINIPKRHINKHYLGDFSEQVYKSGIQYPIILSNKGTKLECILGNTRIQVAIMLKIPTISCLLLTDKYYKDLKLIKSFEDFMLQSGLTKSDIQRGLLKVIL